MCFQLLKLVGEKMNIKEIDYKENAKISAEMLDKYTKNKKPEALDILRKKISFVLEDEGQIVSRLTGSISFNGLHIELFITDSNTRGKGYGTEIFKFVEELAREKGYHYIVLETMSFNAPRFYINRGFEIIKKVDNTPIEGESFYFMFKSLR